MQVRVITMKYSEGQQGFSEETLRSATFGRDVLACETSRMEVRGERTGVSGVRVVGRGVPTAPYRVTASAATG
mgnify:CR=1 FL=1